MFRRKKQTGSEAGAGGNGAGPEADEGPSPTDEVPSEAGAPAEAEAQAPAEAPPPPPPPPTTEPEDGYYDDDRLPVSYWVESVLDTSAPPSREELERQAEADFRAAIAPGLEGLREAVPDASSPDEAMQALEARQGEHLPDPEGANLSQRDIYRNEASVYYRIRNHFDLPRRRVGWGEPWRPPPAGAQPDAARTRRALGRGPG
jgi:hypothetical protein